jgi:hypothetical protein
MVNVDKIKRGIALYIDRDILPKLQIGAFKRFAVATAAALFVDNTANNVAALTKNAVFATLGISDADGNIDIEKLANEAKKHMPDEGLTMDLNILGMHLGGATFHRADVDVLRGYILN